ncbi:hypothetical protein BH11BAC1_BH11BAC1_23300 [soil metagenome]
MKIKSIVFCMFLAFINVLISGCKQEDSNPSSSLMIRMKDAPASFDQVNVEVVEIQIHNDVNGWQVIPVTDSIYDLLLLQGNTTTFLANAILPSGNISQVRLLLGTQNSVKVAGVVYPLSLSSEDETGLKLNIHQNLLGGVTYDLLIDFHADESIVEEGNGTYKLKPVLSASFN